MCSASCTRHIGVINCLANTVYLGKWRQQHWQPPLRPAPQPPLARLQSEVVVEDEDADQGGAEVVVEAPQEELQQHRVGLRCLKEQPLQEGLSYQRQTEMRRSRNKTGQSLRPTGKQLPLLKLLPPPLNLLLFLNLPLLKYQPPLLNLLQ